MSKTDPAEFADTEVIKARLEDIQTTLDRLVGILEALMAELGAKIASGKTGFDI